MNADIILSMAQPYVKENTITYKEFDGIYKILSLQEKYEVVEILYAHNISLVDELFEDDISEDSINTQIPDMEDDDDKFEVLYDKSIFSDGEDDAVFLYTDIKQSSENLCVLIQEGNLQALQDICVKNKGLVDKWANIYQKYYGSRLEFEDLEQEGFLGLIKAAQRYDAKKDARFSTYAVIWIKQAIRRSIEDAGYVIRIPVHKMDRIYKVMRYDSQLEGLTYQERIHEISHELLMPVAEVEDCIRLYYQYLRYNSLNTPVGEEQETELGDLVPDLEAESIEGIIIENALKENLDVALSSLKEREQKVLRYRFGLDDGKARTLEEVGVIFGVTRERIRQIEAKALRKLRHPSRSRKLKDFL